MTAPRSRRPVEAADQPAQRLLQGGPLDLADPVDLAGPCLAGLDGGLGGQQRLEVALERLGQTVEKTGECRPQRGELIAPHGAALHGLVVALVEPGQQCHLLGDRQLRVEPRARPVGDPPRPAGVVQP